MSLLNSLALFVLAGLLGALLVWLCECDDQPSQEEDPWYHQEEDQ